MEAVQVTLLLIAANGAPLVASKLLGDTMNQPIDGGYRFVDGNYLFGRTKTWRGLFAAIGCTVLLSWLLGLSGWLGIVIALAAMVGDLTSSFIKRRLDLPSSAKCTGLDQLPEAVLPMILAVTFFGVGRWEATFAVVVFMLGDIVVSPLLYRLGWRRVPH